jgi:membrane protease YdiL (CAAX protease family)
MIPEANLRPGAAWRFLRLPLTRIVSFCAALLAARMLVEAAARALHIRPHGTGGLTAAAVTALLVLATYYGCVRLLEQRAVVELGGARRDLVPGLIGGMLLFAAVMLLLIWLKVATVTRSAGIGALAYPFAAALLAAVFEETLIRGTLFRILEESLGSWIALAFTAALFGALHAFNRGATLTSSVAVALEAGVLLAALYMYSRSLWAPIGVHAGWNFAEGGLFGASVSGTTAHGMLASTFHGPDFLTGGQFGPEASIVAVVLCLSAGVAFTALAVRRGQILPPRWRRTQSDATPAETLR